jgi:hypothetical protein
MLRFFLMFGVMGAGVAAPAAGRGAVNEDASTGAVRTALVAAATVSDARVEITAIERARTGCVGAGAPARAEVSRSIDGSARVAVKLIGAGPDGASCEAWSWVRFRLFAPVSVAIRAVRVGEPLAGATAVNEREIKAGRAPATPSDVTDGAVADRPLVAGQIVEADAIRVPGPRAGDPVNVVLVTGALAVEQVGRAVPCARNRSCAVLPSGKHVDGTFRDGRLLVQMP